MREGGERDLKKILFVMLLFFAFTYIKVYSFDIPQIEGYSVFSQTVSDIVSGKFSLNPIDIFNNIVFNVTDEIKGFTVKTVSVIVLAMLSSTVNTFNSALGENDGSKAAFFVFFSLLSGVALSCFETALLYANDVISLMTSFMNKFTPVLMVTLFACGKTVSAVSFEPVMSASVVVISIIIEKCLIPLMVFSAVLAVASNVGDGAGISGFIKIIKSITRWLMAFVITLFTGINAVYGLSVSTLDAVSAKTMKFAVGSLVPVVGGFLSDTLETVLSSAKLLKNAVGVSGVLILCGMCIVPVIKIGIMQLMLKFCAALTEPITDKRISLMLWSVSEAITSVFGTLILTAVLFLINICLIVGVTGI